MNVYFVASPSQDAWIDFTLAVTDYLALFERLKQRVDTVNPKGALRYPAF